MTVRAPLRLVAWSCLGLLAWTCLGLAAGCSPKGTRKFFASCATDAECDSGLCREAICTRSCASSAQCGEGVCNQAICQPFVTVACTTDAACQALLPAGGCQVAACVAGRCSAQVQCDDGNPCTTDGCDQGGCRHDPGSGPCDDGDVCTLADACTAAECHGIERNCSDDDPCTTDSCGDQGCAHVGIAGCCSPKIVAGSTVSCGQTNGVGTCLGTVRICAGIESCDAPLPASETCNGLDDDCDGAADDGTCDDGDPCTADSCKAAQCQHSSLTGSGCDDGDACTAPDLCGATGCAGVPIGCDDGNTCTLDACDVSQGCTHGAATGECDDGNPCTGSGMCSKGQCGAGQPTLWNYLLGGPGDDTGRGIVYLAPTANHPPRVVISGGTQGGQGTSQQGLIAGLDLFGAQAWSLSPPGNGNLANLVVSGDSVVAVGQILPEAQTATDGWIVHVDGSGKLMGTLSLGGPLGDVLRDVVVAPNGGLIAAGLTGAGGQHQVWLVGVDAAVAQVTWQKALAPGGYDDGRALAVLPDGGVAVVGSSAPTSTVAPEGLLVRTDGQGTLLWSKTYAGATSALNDVVVQPDGFVLAGARAGAGETSHMLLLKTNLAGQLLWLRNLAQPVDGVVFGLLATNTGYLLAGTGRTAVGQALDVWTLRTDALGNLASSWHLAATGDDRIQAVAAMPGGGFLLTGSTQATATGKADVWVARADSFSHVDCAQAGGCASKSGPACDDGNGCTADDCDPILGCTHTALTDGSPCTSGTCKAGVCN